MRARAVLRSNTSRYWIFFFFFCVSLLDRVFNRRGISFFEFYFKQNFSIAYLSTWSRIVRYFAQVPHNNNNNNNVQKDVMRGVRACVLMAKRFFKRIHASAGKTRDRNVVAPRVHDSHNTHTRTYIPCDDRWWTGVMVFVVRSIKKI